MDCRAGRAYQESHLEDDGRASAALLERDQAACPWVQNHVALQRGEDIFRAIRARIHDGEPILPEPTDDERLRCGGWPTPDWKLANGARRLTTPGGTGPHEREATHLVNGFLGARKVCTGPGDEAAGPAATVQSAGAIHDTGAVAGGGAGVAPPTLKSG